MADVPSGPSLDSTPHYEKKNRVFQRMLFLIITLHLLGVYVTLQYRITNIHISLFAINFIYIFDIQKRFILMQLTVNTLLSI
jgi:hypothetical protein